MRYKLGRIFFILGLAAVLSWGEINSIDSAVAEGVEVPSYFKLSVSAEKHNDYGFTYPVTFQFSIPYVEDQDIVTVEERLGYFEAVWDCFFGGQVIL